MSSSFSDKLRFWSEQVPKGMKSMENSQSIKDSYPREIYTPSFSLYCGYAENDKTPPHEPHQIDHLDSIYIRPTNVTGVYLQKTGDCYAHASASAYLNTVMRIKGIQKQVPSFADCFALARYNEDKGGSPMTSLKKIEEVYKFGVLFEETQELPLIRDICIYSVILIFDTTEEGYQAIARGSLTKKPTGEISEGGHCVLIEGYDFERDLCICKNSWGKDTSRMRFEVNIGALHRYSFVKVYWTLNSIKQNLIQTFKMEKFLGYYKGHLINCAWMDKTTAIYTSEYICDPHEEKQGPYCYLGYDINQYIDLRIQRKEKIIRNDTNNTSQARN